MPQKLTNQTQRRAQILKLARRRMSRAMHFGSSKILQTHPCYRPIANRLALAVIGAIDPHRISGFPPSGVGDLQVLDDRLRHEQINCIVHDLPAFTPLPRDSNRPTGEQDIATFEVFDLTYPPASVEQWVKHGKVALTQE